jgi:hypothetical protein
MVASSKFRTQARNGIFSGAALLEESLPTGASFDFTALLADSGVFSATVFLEDSFFTGASCRIFSGGVLLENFLVMVDYVDFKALDGDRVSLKAR